MPERAGVVVAACLSETGGLPKYPQPSVTVTNAGVVGDYHARKGARPAADGSVAANPRAVSIVAKEVFHSLRESLQIELAPGAFAENFLTEGLGDLSDLAPGDRIALGADVVVEVTGQNEACSNLTVYHPGIAGSLAGKRGIIGGVVSTGTVRPGDAAVILRRRDG